MSIKGILRFIVLLQRKEREILIVKMFFISIMGCTNDSNLFETFMNYIYTCSMERWSLGILHQDDLLLHTAHCTSRSQIMLPWNGHLVYNNLSLLFAHPHIIHSFISHHFVTLLYRIVNVYVSYELLRQGGQRT